MTIQSIQKERNMIKEHETIDIGTILILRNTTGMI